MPEWSPDGTQIAYARCGRAELSNCDLFVMDADGSNRTRLTNTPDAQETWPAWSPDGAKILHLQPGRPVPGRVRDGRRWLEPGPPHHHARVRCLPGMLPRRRSHRLHQRPPGARRHLRHGRRRVEPDPRHAWEEDRRAAGLLTDGATLVFSRNGNDLWTVAPDGTGLTQLTFTERRSEFAPAYSPDGTKITYNRVSSSGRVGVWIIGVDGTNAVHQTFGTQDLFPDWGTG